MPDSEKSRIDPGAIFIKRRAIHLLYLSFTISGLLFYSCSKNKVDESKVISKLISDAKASITDCTCEPVINQYRWGPQIIYIKNCNGPLCNCVSFFYNEKGEEFYPGTNTGKILHDAKLLKNIWTCP